MFKQNTLQCTQCTKSSTKGMGGTWAEVRADLCAALNCVPATFFADRHRSRSLPPTSNTHEEMTWHDFNPTSMPLVLDTWWRLCLTCHGLDLLKNLGTALSKHLSEKAQCCQWLILRWSCSEYAKLEKNASPLGGGGSSSKFGTVYLGWEGRGMTSGEMQCTWSWCLDQKREAGCTDITWYN